MSNFYVHNVSYRGRIFGIPLPLFTKTCSNIFLIFKSETKRADALSKEMFLKTLIASNCSKLFYFVCWSKSFEELSLKREIPKAKMKANNVDAFIVFPGIF